MSVLSEVGSLIKRMFLVSEELTRLSTELKEVSRDVKSHEIRLKVIETTLALTHRSTNRILPGE